MESNLLTCKDYANPKEEEGTDDDTPDKRDDKDKGSYKDTDPSKKDTKKETKEDTDKKDDEEKADSNRWDPKQADEVKTDKKSHRHRKGKKADIQRENDKIWDCINQNTNKCLSFPYKELKVI